MNVIQIEYPAIPSDSPSSVAAIGYFDGLHLGHQRVIGHAIQAAKEKGLHSSVMTFHPHPRQVLHPDGGKPYFYITPLPDKLDLLRQMGVETAFVVHFTAGLSRLSPEQFVREVLLPLRIQHVVVGFDFRFGRGALGNPDLLKELGEGFLAVDVIEPVRTGGVKVSSSLIREHLQEGKMEEVSRLLARPYSFRGRVVRGEQRGRALGFPTANLRLLESYFLPRNGVYGVRADLGEARYFGVMNIGLRPTFHQGGERSIEVHLLGFSGDLYHREIKVEVLFFIRPEQRFENISSLVKQVESDIQFAKDKFMCYTI